MRQMAIREGAGYAGTRLPTRVPRFRLDRSQPLLGFYPFRCQISAANRQIQTLIQPRFLSLDRRVVSRQRTVRPYTRGHGCAPAITCCLASSKVTRSPDWIAAIVMHSATDWL